MKKLALASAIASCLGLSFHASAESTTGNAQALLLTTISFYENQVVDFKTIPNGTGVCSMSSVGVLGGHCAGSPDGIPGEFIVSGTAGQWVDVTVSNGSTDNGVTFNPMLGEGGITSTSVSLGSGIAIVDVFGELVLSNAAGGQRGLTFTLSVDYQ